MTFEVIQRWWKRLIRRRRYGKVVVVDSMSAVPERMGGTIFIVRRGGFDRRAAFGCPCRCGRRIDLNLVRNAQQPSWSAAIEGDTVTLHPSVWLRQDPCKSHFFVRGSRVIWA
jgi:hypothetical protein